MDPERIWLQPDCGQCAAERCWCRDELEACEDCGARPVEYIRADVAHALYAAGQRDMQDRAALCSQPLHEDHEMNDIGEDYFRVCANNAALQNFETIILALEIKDAPQ
jgi:hypothetical protein